MDPGKLAADLVQKNFGLFGSFRKKCSYLEKGDAVLDPETGIVSRETLSTTYPLFIVFDLPSPNAYRNIKLPDDSSITIEMRVAIFPSLDLDPVEPKVKDVIVREDSSQWEVIGNMPDPKPAVYQLIVKPYLE